MGSFLAPAPEGKLEPGGRPTFSVIVPVYQAATTIASALDSLRRQTLAPTEVLVCDDGSTDDLDAALEPYRDWIVLLRQENRGVSAARNAMLRQAAGDFVVPLDADDAYAPTRLQRMAELAAERPDLDLLATDALLTVDGREFGRFNTRTPFATKRQDEEILDRCFLICPAMRRERLLAIGGYDEELRSGGDWDCYIRLVHAGARAGLVDEPLLEYRLGRESITSRRVDTLTDRVRIFEKVLREPELSTSLRRVARAALSRNRGRALQRIAREAALGGDPEARGKLLAVSRSRNVPLRARAGALAASLAPSRARRIVEAALADSSGRPD
jgi:glycosyltransferase involved in cell wall biosynthesis